MCDAISRIATDPAIPESSRRAFVKALGLAAGGVAVSGSLPSGRATAALPGASGKPKGRTRLVLLGTAGGPAFYSGDHFGVSTAVVYRDRVYVVDLGLGAMLRLRQSGLSGPTGIAGSLANVRGIFFTHMHSDHMTDWPAVYGTGVSNAIGRDSSSILVRGPGPRDTLPRVYPPGRPAPAVFNPNDPTPGVQGMTSYLRQAWATDLNDRARDNNFRSPDSLFQVEDINLTGVWSVDPEGKPPRLAQPIHVWDDDDVKVTATLVDHHPTAPAFAYRFDTPDGSIVISGDTAVSQNLIDLADGVDYLIHEVIDPAFIERVTATLPADQAGPLREHLLASHTTIEQVGRDVAQPAGAKHLVLTHLAPANNPKSRWVKAQKGYSGKVIVGEDLLELTVKRQRKGR